MNLYTVLWLRRRPFFFFLSCSFSIVTSRKKCAFVSNVCECLHRIDTRKQQKSNLLEMNLLYAKRKHTLTLNCTHAHIYARSAQRKFRFLSHSLFFLLFFYPLGRRLWWFFDFIFLIFIYSMVVIHHLPPFNRYYGYCYCCCCGVILSSFRCCKCSSNNDGNGTYTKLL